MTAHATSCKARRYWMQVPNLLDDSDLDPYARTLYLHYLRLGGVQGHACEEPIRQTAATCRMSVGAVVKARAELVAQGWVETASVEAPGHGAGYRVTVVNRWADNEKSYTRKDRERSPHERSQGPERSPHEHLAPSERSPHERSEAQKSVERSPHERQRSPGEQERSPHERSIVTSALRDIELIEPIEVVGADKAAPATPGSVDDLSDDNLGKPRKTRVDAPFIARMVALYAADFGDVGVRERIKRAVSHKGYVFTGDKQGFVADWLRKDADDQRQKAAQRLNWAAGRSPGRSTTAPTGPSTQAGPSNYDDLIIRLPSVGGTHAVARI